MSRTVTSTRGLTCASVSPLARIIHQPEKSTREGSFGARMLSTTTVCEDHHAPQTSAAACPGRVHMSLMVAIVSRSGTMPPVSLLGLGVQQLFCTCSFDALDRVQWACTVQRTHANKVKRRLNTGATGHDEGNDIWIRSLHSGTRAPSLSQRHWIVSIVAGAYGVVLNTSRRKVSRNT